MAKSNTRITADKDEVALYTYEYTATSGQTTFSGSDDNSNTLDYTAGSITVSYGGLELPESDYTATNGTSIVLADGAVAGEIIRVVAYEPFVVSDALPITGGTLTGGLNVSSGNVSIGTTSPVAKLDVLAGADQRLIFTTLGTDPFIGAVNADNSAYKPLQLNGADMKLLTGGTERMRLDSSGNVLVGKTALNGNTTGFQVEPAGAIAVTRSGSTTAYFNRQSSDGDIMAFRKDGTTVGSIGSNNSDLTIGNDDTGLKFHDVNNTIYPFNTTTAALSDGVVSWGASNYRYKDAHFSGTVSGSVDSRTLFTHTYVGPLSPTARVFTNRSSLQNAGLVNGGTYIFTAFLNSYFTGITSYSLSGCTRPWTFATTSSNNGSHTDIGEFVWQGHAYHPTVTISYRMEYNGSGGDQDFMIRSTGTTSSDFAANVNGKQLTIFVKRIA